MKNQKLAEEVYKEYKECIQKEKELQKKHDNAAGEEREKLYEEFTVLNFHTNNLARTIVRYVFGEE